MVIAPLAENAPGDVARVEGAWTDCGARVFRMSAQELAKTVEPNLPATALVGRTFAGKGRVVRVFSEVRQPGRVLAEVEGRHPIYPGTELLCLE